MSLDIVIGGDAQPASGFDIVIGDTGGGGPAVELPGPTIDAMQSGSCAIKYVAAIEGYRRVLTDATAEQAVDAWDGLDWEHAVVGLTVDLRNDQRINPWDPFTRGGTLRLCVAPDDDDLFGIETHRKTAGFETMLGDTVGPTDTPVPVLSTTSFSSSSDELYIGTEAMGYEGKTGTTFTTVTRGKWAPFTVDGGATSRFGHHHEVGTDPNAVQLRPLVTSQPRVWIGKWVGLWTHLYDHEVGVLNTRDDAQLVYAGRITKIADDSSTANTIVHCEHVLDYLKRAVLGRDMWSAKVVEGMELAAGMQFHISDSDDDGATWNTADPLIVKVSGASGPNEINEGTYTVSEIHTMVNAWLAAELDDGRIDGYYHLAINPWQPNSTATPELRTYFAYRIQGTGPAVFFRFAYPEPVSRFFGSLADSLINGGALLGGTGEPATDYDRVSARVPLRSMLSFASLSALELYDERGTFVDQFGALPSYPQGDYAHNTFGYELGLVLFGADHAALVAKDGAAFRYIADPPVQYAGADWIPSYFDRLAEVPYDDDGGPIIVKQILIRQGTCAQVIKELFYSVNGSNYNHATYDVLPQALGLGIPGSLLGDAFESSVDAMPGADNPFTLIIDEPTKLEELLKGALVFRWTFLRWMDQGIQFCPWKTPTTGVELNESNKAAPVGNEDDQRSASESSDEWVRQYIKVDYDRDITANESGGGYRSSITVVDRVAVDDAGGDAKTVTISLREAYGESGVQALAGQFLSGAPMFTRPITKTVRPIDMRYFEGLGVGDCVDFKDKFSRDPDTGRREVSVRPAVIIAHRWTPGGLQPNGSIADMTGEVELLFADTLRIAQYVPTAQLDEGSTNAGYVVATKTGTCHSHKYSESGDAADATRFTAGMNVKVVERDPANPAAPSTHDDVIASQTGDTFVLTTGFAGWDNTKRYDIVFDGFADATTAQQAGFVFQADDADGLIADARVPFQYVNPSFDPTVPFTANTAGDPVLLPADVTYGDGAGLDVGTDIAIVRLLNNLLDYKTAHISPWLSSTEMSGAAATGTWLLVAIRSMNLTGEVNSNSVRRQLSVAAFMKSSDGASASVRVSLVRYRPADDTINDIDRGALLDEVTFTTSTTTYATQAAQDLEIGQIKNHTGICYLLIECTVKARTYGLGSCQEGPRT